MTAKKTEALSDSQVRARQLTMGQSASEPAPEPDAEPQSEEEDSDNG